MGKTSKIDNLEESPDNLENGVQLVGATISKIKDLASYPQRSRRFSALPVLPLVDFDYEAPLSSPFSLSPGRASFAGGTGAAGTSVAKPVLQSVRLRRMEMEKRAGEEARACL